MDNTQSPMGGLTQGQKPNQKQPLLQLASFPGFLSSSLQGGCASWYYPAESLRFVLGCFCLVG